MADVAPGVPLVLDTDIGTNVDDAFALAFAVRHPGLELRAVTTVSGDVRTRARIARKLLSLAGREDVEVAAGRTVPVPAGGRRPWLGHEGIGLLDRLKRPDGDPDEPSGVSPRDAVDVLLDHTARAAEAGDPAALVTLGMHTNVAAALDVDPALPARVARLAVMGGMFVAVDEDGLRPEDEHNLNVDPQAALRVLHAGFPVLYAPTDVTAQARLEHRHLEQLRRGDRLCRALAALTEVWTPILRRRRPSLPADQVAGLHDAVTVACLVPCGQLTVERRGVRVAVVDGIVRTLSHPAGHPAGVLTAVADDFADFWVDTVCGGAGR